jgi:hypothetical protein
MAIPTGEVSTKVYLSNIQVKRHPSGEVGSASCHMTPVEFDLFPGADGRIEINLRLKFPLKEIDLNQHTYEVSIRPIDLSLQVTDE